MPGVKLKRGVERQGDPDGPRWRVWVEERGKLKRHARRADDRRDQSAAQALPHVEPRIRGAAALDGDAVSGAARAEVADRGQRDGQKAHGEELAHRGQACRRSDQRDEEESKSHHRPRHARSDAGPERPQQPEDCPAERGALAAGMRQPCPCGELGASGEQRNPERELCLVRQEARPKRRRRNDAEPRELSPGGRERLRQIGAVGHRAHISRPDERLRCVGVGEGRGHILWVPSTCDVQSGRDGGGAQLRRDERLPAMWRALHPSPRGPDALRPLPGARSSWAREGSPIPGSVRTRAATPSW